MLRTLFSKGEQAEITAVARGTNWILSAKGKGKGWGTRLQQQLPARGPCPHWARTSLSLTPFSQPTQFRWSPLNPHLFLILFSFLTLTCSSCCGTTSSSVNQSYN